MDPIKNRWNSSLPGGRIRITAFPLPGSLQTQQWMCFLQCLFVCHLLSHGLVETMFGRSKKKHGKNKNAAKHYDLYRSLFLGGRFVSISFHWFDRCGFSTHSFPRGPGEPLHCGRWRRNIDWHLWLGTALWSAWGLKRRTLLKRFTEKWMQVSFLLMFEFVYVYIDVYAVRCYYQDRYYCYYHDYHHDYHHYY